MADFPFKDAEFASDVRLVQFPVIDYTRVYYTVLNGNVTAIKPIAVGIYYNSGLQRVVLAALPDGSVQQFPFGREYFKTPAACIESVRHPRGVRTDGIEWKNRTLVITEHGGTVSLCGDSFSQYEWVADQGRARNTVGCYKFWADVDGEHVVFRDKLSNGTKLYPAIEACVDDNIKVIDFDDEQVPEPAGVYTFQKTFKIKAKTEAEARVFVDSIENEYEL